MIIGKHGFFMWRLFQTKSTHFPIISGLLTCSNHDLFKNQTAPDQEARHPPGHRFWYFSSHRAIQYFSPFLLKTARHTKTGRLPLHKPGQRSCCLAAFSNKVSGQNKRYPQFHTNTYHLPLTLPE